MRCDQLQSNNVELHNITVLDRSGSMQAKWNAACQGVKEDYENCKKEGFKSYTFIQFDYPQKDIVQVSDFKNGLEFEQPRGNTALYDAVGNSLTKAMKTLTGKVLVKIFTDGGENASVKFTASQVAELIKQAESKGYTITFVGTEPDLMLVNRNLGIDMSNMLKHDNTAESVSKGFKMSAEATSTYTKNISKGIDVTTGFYKNISND